MTKHIIIFDVETNGFKGSSVLSVSGLKVKYVKNSNSFEIIDKFSRYYFRNRDEILNEEAVYLNGLTDEKINSLREGQNYPLYFENDVDSFKKFCDNPVLYVAHNISFDTQFIPFISDKDNVFCKMKNNTHTNRNGKWPKLEETARYYKIKIDNNQFHNSEYDTEICLKIFQKMFQDDHPYLKQIADIIKN